MSPVPRETPSNDLISRRVVPRAGSHLKIDTSQHPRPPREPIELRRRRLFTYMCNFPYGKG